MAVFIACLVLFLAMIGHSNAAYCVCNNALSDSVLQKNIDYACGNGADCTQILQNGPCYNPNTVKDHCNYAVNSYYQRQGATAMSCNFQGTASVSQTPPSNVAPGCVYPSSASNAGSSAPPTNPSIPPPTNPSMSPPTNPSISPPGTGTGTGTGTGFPGSATPGSTNTPVFGPGPTGTGLTTPDGTGGAGGATIHQGCNLLVLSAITLFFSGLIW